MQHINWGIIGCGNVTELKSGPAFNKIEGSSLVAVMRRDGEKARDYARRHHVSKWHILASDIIENPEINAVYIATPPSSHAYYAIKAMEAGKAVYVEKPMADSYAKCMAMNDVSQRTGMPLYVAYYRRHLPYFRKIKEILETNYLGKILFVQVALHLPARIEDQDPDNLPWRVDPVIAGGGYFYDMACHQIDLLDWYFGGVTEVKGKSFNREGLYPAEDVVFAEMIHESGVPVTCSWCFTVGSRVQQDKITIFGSKASVEFSTFGFTPIRIIKPESISEELPPNPENIQYWYIRNMVEELQGLRPKTCNGLSAAKTNRIMDIILGKI